MPDLSNIIENPLMILSTQCAASTSTSSTFPQETQKLWDPDSWKCNWNERLRFPTMKRRNTCFSAKKKHTKKREDVKGKSFRDHLRCWTDKKLNDGASELDCELPFLNNAAIRAECRLCTRFIHPGDEILCAVRACREHYHRTCVVHHLRKHSVKEFKCSKHACFLCKKIPTWHCIRCSIACDEKCTPWPEKVLMFGNREGVCWKHPTDWHKEHMHLDPANNFEEAISRLPRPYFDEEFTLGPILNDITEYKDNPCPYIHIRRNVYLIKKERDAAEADVGCTKHCAGSTCDSDCECRGLSVSCSKACHCSNMCTNRPFRKEKRIKLVKVRLAVASAFHESFMKPAVSRLETALAATEIRMPRIPVISNVDAQPHSDPETIKNILACQKTQLSIAAATPLSTAVVFVRRRRRYRNFASALK